MAPHDGSRPQPAGSPRAPRSLLQRAVVAACRWYLHSWHGFYADGLDHLPPTGPLIVVVNHASFLDMVALLAANPFDDARMVAKASLFRIPGLRAVLDAWGAIPVARDGRDVAAVRAMLSHLRRGGVVAIAAEGTRSRDGRLGPINSTLARLVVGANVPIVAAGVSGSFAALPPGGIFPRPSPITLRFGRPFVVPPTLPVDAARERIRAEIAALLDSAERPRD